MQNLLRSRLLGRDTGTVGEGQRQAERGRAAGQHRQCQPRPFVPRLSPHGEVHHVVDLVPPNKAAEGEALELDDEDIGQPPQHQLLGGLTVLLALGAVPGGRARSLPAVGRAPGPTVQPHPKVPQTWGWQRGCRRSQPPLPGAGQHSPAERWHCSLLACGLLPSAQGRPAQRSWLLEETACVPGQLLGKPPCCPRPRAGTRPATFLTTLPPGPGLRAW